ncbi:MAG: 30S ribosome-binding factor RbfA [Solirubrobacterales bacterium]|nr:30S ribosome-binding factor RbfA [Solirubrobacterales bacterium]
MGSNRLRRVDEAIRQVLGDAVGELQDPRVGFVTVTDVRTSPDLRHARVYVSVLGEEATRAATLAGLENAHGHLQSRLATELRLKHTPTLVFRYDETTDRAMRIEELIEQAQSGARAGDGEEHPGSGEPPGGRAQKGQID